MTDDVGRYLTVTGSGPFPLPGERKRLTEAYEKAKRMTDDIESIQDDVVRRREERLTEEAQRLLIDVAARMSSPGHTVMPTDYLKEAVAVALDIVAERQETGPVETIPSIEWTNLARAIRRLS